MNTVILTQTVKRCPRCGEVKPFTAEFFYRDAQNATGLYPVCKDCKKLAASGHYRRHASRIRAKSRAAYHRDKAPWQRLRAKKHGLTAEDVARMERDQGFACAICRQPETQDGFRLAIDHDHETGEVRGLLCSNCNNGLGRFRDRPAVLLAAAAYVARARGAA